MSENIGKSIDQIALAGSVNDDPPEHTTQQVQEKIVGPFCRYPLVKKPTKPTIPPVGGKKSPSWPVPVVEERTNFETDRESNRRYRSRIGRSPNSLGKIPSNQWPRCRVYLS